MERVSKANILSLCLLGLGLGLLALLATELLRPRLVRAPAAAVQPRIGEESRATARILSLLAGHAGSVSGIDREALAARNPFERPAPEVVPAPPAPPPEEPSTPPPPPAKTERLPVLYRGLYRSSTGEAFVYLEIDGSIKVFAMDAEVAPGWRIIEASRRELTLQRGAKPATVLPFNEKKSLEVPIR